MTVDILGLIPGNHSNSIKINGCKIRIPDSSFALLLRFVMELKKGKGGWVNIHDLKEENLVNNPENYQVYSNLRTALQGSLLDKDGQKFIQNDGSKNYRVSTHPDFVSYNKGKLLSHPISDIRNIAAELP